MSSLSSYNPLELIVLPGATLQKPSGLILVIGPNSSGKTLFLQDIQNYLLNGKRKTIVCSDIQGRSPENCEQFLEDLIAINMVRSTTNVNQLVVFVPPMGINLTQQQLNNQSGQFTREQLKQAYKQFDIERNQVNTFFGLIGAALVAPLSLDMRRNVCNKSQGYDYRATPPSVPLQALLLNSTAQDRLVDETKNIFGNVAWLDALSENNTYQLRVSGTSDRPSIGETMNPLKASQFGSIQDEGDGYKSYVGICLSLMLGTRPVTLIDEPELCLHPPQAYHIGRFIGEYATKPEHVTFVATHSSHVLRGILEITENVTVLRLTQKKRSFNGHLLNEEQLVKSLRNPRTRAENVLDGLFSQGVIIVESEGDREVYQAASEAVKGYASKEIHFVSVGGIGGFVEIAKIYHKLHIPAVLIADLDAIAETNIIVDLIRLLCPPANNPVEIIDELHKVVQAIKSLPSAITPDQVKDTLKQISELSIDWNKGDDNVIRNRLSLLVNQIKRIRRLKDGGIQSYSDYEEIETNLRSVVARCRSFGLFFVERGELEDWVPHLMQDCPKGSMSKSERARIASIRIREELTPSGDVWEFMNNVLAFLTGLQNK